MAFYRHPPVQIIINNNIIILRSSAVNADYAAERTWTDVSNRYASRTPLVIINRYIVNVTVLHSLCAYCIILCIYIKYIYMIYEYIVRISWRRRMA